VKPVTCRQGQIPDPDHESHASDGHEYVCGGGDCVHEFQLQLEFEFEDQLQFE